MRAPAACHWRTAARLLAGNVRNRRAGAAGHAYGRRMTSEHNKRTISDAWKAFASRDPKRIASWFTEDAEWLAPRGNATALALDAPDHMIGPEAIVHFLAEKFPALFVSDVAVDFRSRYCEGDTVIVELRLQATLANGRRYDNDYCFIFELRDGRIARVREYMDTQKGRACIFG
jgi:ketosteroid isomerase-like protein